MITLFIPENQYFVRKTDYVLESLRTSILLGYIPPGTSITERQIKDVLKVSSSPIREALNQLEAEGLLTRSPHVGTRVAEIVVEDASELYSIQALLQSSAVQICTKKLSETNIRDAEKLNNQIEDIVSSGNVDVSAVKILNYRFHTIVCGISVHPWLTRLISALWIRLPNKTIWLLPNEAKIAVKYHKKILGAIKKRDAVLAGTLMKEHLQRSHKALYG
ncbi:MAG: GntR family transcriptional regulator [candidate division NC10 bacterium]|nr:GntR family transcriptional regulator [candidate division NC10 bacterium]